MWVIMITIRFYIYCLTKIELKFILKCIKLHNYSDREMTSDASCVVKRVVHFREKLQTNRILNQLLYCDKTA